jgi:hypothetical protein
MQSNELSDFIKKIPSLKNHFVGVFAIDLLPETIENRQFLFCNTAPHNEIGEHWFCLSKINNEIEVFDSLGVDDAKKDLLRKFCKIKTKSKLKINDTAVQSRTSTSCGLFVLYFAINRFHNADLGFNTLLNEIFSFDVSLNEQLVSEFCQTF